MRLNYWINCLFGTVFSLHSESCLRPKLSNMEPGVCVIAAPLAGDSPLCRYMFTCQSLLQQALQSCVEMQSGSTLPPVSVESDHFFMAPPPPPPTSQKSALPSKFFSLSTVSSLASGPFEALGLRVCMQRPSAPAAEDRKLLRRACGMRGIASVVYQFLLESSQRP